MTVKKYTINHVQTRMSEGQGSSKLLCKAIKQLGINKGEPCHNKAGENGYCGKHQRQAQINESPVPLCKCMKPAEEGRKTCNECRKAQLDKEHERRANKVEKSIENQNNDINSCRKCGKEYTSFETLNKKPSTKCPKCYDKQRTVEKQRIGERIRDYAADKYRNIESAYKTHINDCKRRNIINELSFEEYKALVYDAACIYCSFSEAAKIIGIDRLDNNVGYTVDNSVSCCGDCNRVKYILHPEFFIEKALIIAEYQNNKSSEPANKLYADWAEYFRKDHRQRSYTNYKKNVIEKRGLTFELIEEKFHEYFDTPCTYCGVSSIKTGIDRIDSDKGYTEDNCVSCCATCNISKSNYSPEKYVDINAKIKKPEIWTKITQISRTKYIIGTRN